MDKIDYLLIKDFLPQNEFDAVLNELDFLRSSGQLVTPEQSGSAREDGVLLKQNKAIFLNDVYKRPQYSPTMNYVVKRLFSGVTMQYSEMSLWNRGILKTNFSSTMVSYYEETDRYLPHSDDCVVTVLYWIWREPKSFTGGDLTLNDIGKTIPVTNNTMLLFPGHCIHEVSPVKINEGSPDGYGRWCISTFLLTGTTYDNQFECYLTDGAGFHKGLPRDSKNNT